ncbi:subtilisin family serine protease [Agromyces sp. 3263]|uniref:S8 family serine peptidase n=1 Tax=Agromyces sp. 3263 TaxID=2817750 RepID=UPI002862084C|nr:S8 family serine peptidase [Agromyces sp. 3263]MDR6905950.1 subtilisin family serine protease [Agromyces sp. 3263]
MRHARWTRSRGGWRWLAALAATAMLATGAQGAVAAPDPAGTGQAGAGDEAQVEVAVPGATPEPAEGAEAKAETEPRTYIVQLALDPVATYDGGVPGLNRTRPERGKKLDPQAPEVAAYSEHLHGAQRAALAKVSKGTPRQQYVYAFDGFSAELTAAQAADLAAQPEVVAVTPDELVESTTSNTPSFLGLDAPGGIWEQLGGPEGSTKTAGAGEDIVIGVIDSGIWPDSPSFSDRVGNAEKGKLAYKPLKFAGRCDSEQTVGDDSWDADLCNKKLLGARHFNAAWGGDAGVAAELPWEFLSPRDYNGHGTHTASTAAGNHDVEVTGPAAPLGAITGIAPRARVAAYKALWSAEDGSTANGYNSDIVAAIDQAVADGVDVINFSVSGTASDLLDAAEIAFLNAAASGIFVAASAGNDGPTAGTVAHPSPWVTTVAAGTHNRSLVGSVTLGDGSEHAGASAAPTAVGPAPFIDSARAGIRGAADYKVEQCWAASDNGGTPVLDPALVAGKIVLCDRGENARVNKSRAVAEAGGIGMVLVNTAPDNVVADFHAVPTVHVADTERGALKAYAATAGATATIAKGEVNLDAPAPTVAAFSSRGPSSAAGGDLLKPDLIAPGQDILAAVAPPGQAGMDFNLMSGTSMSAPHVAGLAALLADRHPDWSPMMIKSALMTTGTDVLDGDPGDPTTLYGQGAGHVVPNSAVDPGLVYDSGVDDWMAFLCGTTNGVEPQSCDDLEAAGHSLDASDLNLASIAIGRVNGTEQTVTRSVTNVGDAPSTYTAQVTGLEGLTVTVEPSTLTLQPGQSAAFALTLTVPEGTQSGALAGQLTWSDGDHDVRSPIVVRGLRNGAETWEARFDGPAGPAGRPDDEAFGSAVTSDGSRLIVAGNSYPAGFGTFRPDFITAAYDPESGEELWSTTYDGPVQGGDELTGFGLSPDGSTVFVAGSSGGEGTESDFVTIAYDSTTGEQRWLQRFDEQGSGDFAAGLTVSPTGDLVFITGMATREQSTDYATIAYDAATGEQVWISYFDGPGQETEDPRDIAVSPDGSTVVVTGQSAGAEGSGLTNFGTVAYAAATGAELWSAQHDGPAHGIDLPTAVAIAETGTVFVSGSSGAESNDWATIAYDGTTGEEIWTTRYDGDGAATDTPRTSVVSPDGATLVVTGNSDGVGTDSDYATVAYDIATGAQLWVARHAGTANALDIAQSATVTPDGRHVIITGFVDNVESRRDYETIAYSLATGEQVWSADYDAGSGTDAATAITSDVTDEGRLRVFVSGSSAVLEGFDESDSDMTTLSYVDPLPAG